MGTLRHCGGLQTSYWSGHWKAPTSLMWKSVHISSDISSSWPACFHGKHPGSLLNKLTRNGYSLPFSNVHALLISQLNERQTCPSFCWGPLTFRFLSRWLKTYGIKDWTRMRCTRRKILSQKLFWPHWKGEKWLFGYL